MRLLRLMVKTLSDAHISQPLRSCSHLIYLPGDREIAPEEASSASGICCYQQSQHLSPSDMIPESDGANLKQLVKAKNMGILEMCPEDEAEGELIFYQHRLLCNVGARKHLIGLCIVPF